MRLLLLAALAATFACGADVEVGLVSCEKSPAGYLNLAATYSAGNWAEPSESAAYSDWRLSAIGLPHGIFRTIGLCFLRQCFITDLRCPIESETHPLRVVVSTVEQTPVPFEDVTNSVELKPKIEAVFRPAMNQALASIVESKHLRPTRIIGRTQDAAGADDRIVRSQSAIAGQTYYHVRYSSEVFDAHAADRFADCKYFLFTFEGWLSQSASGTLQMIGSEPLLDDCEGTGGVYVDPIGALQLDNVIFAVADESYYENRTPVILRLSPRSANLAFRKQMIPE